MNRWAKKATRLTDEFVDVDVDVDSDGEDDFVLSVVEFNIGSGTLAPGERKTVNPLGFRSLSDDSATRIPDHNLSVAV